MKLIFRSCSGPFCSSLLLFAFTLAAGAALRVEVVDDTGDANAPYLLLVGKDVAGVSPGTMNVDAGTGQLAKVNAGASFTEATATATVSGSVTVVSVTNAGSGYTSAPTVAFTGGGGSGATATANLDAGGSVLNFTITNGGSGYTSAPTVVLTGGGGTNAAATATLGKYRVDSLSLATGGSGYQATGSIPVQFTGGYDNTTTLAQATATVSGGTVTGLTVTNSGSNYVAAPGVSIPNSITPLPLTLLQDTGYTVVSPRTGQTRTVRYFTVSSLGSGAFMVFRNDGTGVPFIYANNQNPTPENANYRFDQCEITFNPSIQSGANLTSINALSMPMQFELFTGTPPTLTLTDRRGYYRSLNSILNLFPKQLGAALSKKGATSPSSGWQPGTDSLATFLRILGPGTLAAVTTNNPTGSPSPYPSFKTYLQSLADLAPTTPAAATATVTDGLITSITVTNAGSGYKASPAVTLRSTSASATNRGGGATAIATHKLGSVTLTDGGSGYTSAPTVTLTGGGGTGAAAIANVTGGSVSGITIQNPGTGYTSAPKVEFTGGGGSGAYAEAALDLATVDTVKVTAGGSNYTSGQVDVVFSTFNVSGSANGADYNYSGTVRSATNGNGFQIVLDGTTYAVNTSNPYAGGVNAKGTAIPTNAQVIVNLPETLTQATATATVNASGTVTAVTLTQGGRGYTSTPTVTIAGPPTLGGTTATIAAVMTGDSVSGFTGLSGGSGYLQGSPPVVTVNQPAGSMDTFIYGATLSGDVFTVGNLPPSFVNEDTNIVYGSIVRDALAVLNFGYLAGVRGNAGSEWYASIPANPPFGSTRKKNDGYYNPFAALLYNTSDAYGFAFSDRINPSPLLTLQDNTTLRITLLPDVWMDPPTPLVSARTDTSLDITWQKVSGATSYTLSVLDPKGIAPVTLSADTASTTLSPLQPGTPYTFTLSANGSGSVKTESQPVQASTTGAAVTSTGAVSYNMTLAFTPPPSLLAGTLTAEVAGETLTYTPSNNQWLKAGANAPVKGSVGANSYVVKIYDSSGTAIYQTNASVNLIASTGTLTTAADCSYFANGSVTVAGSGPGTVLSLILPPPSPLKTFAPVALPGVSFSSWVAGYSGLAGSTPVADPDADGNNNLGPIDILDCTDCDRAV